MCWDKEEESFLRLFFYVHQPKLRYKRIVARWFGGRNRSEYAYRVSRNEVPHLVSQNSVPHLVIKRRMLLGNPIFIHFFSFAFVFLSVAFTFLFFLCFQRRAGERLPAEDSGVNDFMIPLSQILPYWQMLNDPQLVSPVIRQLDDPWLHNLHLNASLTTSH